MMKNRTKRRRKSRSSLARRGHESAKSTSNWTIVAAFISAIAAVAAALFSMRGVSVTERQAEQTRQSHYQDRFDRAATQLGTREAEEVRIAAIASFERLVDEAPQFREPVLAVLSGFIRVQSPAASCERSVGIDVQAAVKVVGKRHVPPPKDISDYPLDLGQACLRGADLSHLNLARVNLAGAKLSGASLRGTVMEGAYLMNTDLSRTFMIEADFTCATIGVSDFSGAALALTKFTGAELIGPNFTDATFINVNIDYAVMREVHLTPEQEVDSSRATTHKHFCIPPHQYSQGPVI